MVKMTHQSRAELANAIRARYRSASGEQKRKILDEFIAVTGYHEKSAIRVLNAKPGAKGRQGRTRVSLYDAATRHTSSFDRALGGLRSGVRKASAGIVADAAASLGAQWAFTTR
ncbi:MAG: hypothetical protein HC872_08775 [Gammaproteobacteria bacterium]|nr:hypothetical protein [Gammaproteobacteria bacterium]